MPQGPTRRELLEAGAATLLAGSLATACRPSEPERDLSANEPQLSSWLDEVTIDELQRRMASGETTSREITTLYLERIERLDRAGPTLRSVLETNPDALAIAEELDRERAAGGLRGPLHGVPILLKDNIATADRTTTTAGSLALEGSIPSADAFVAQRLRAAGAVLLGKANLSEWANFRSQRSSSGWSARGGLCKNPYALDRNPCGSSSGSGAAASANLCAAAIGSETNGSIVCPSSACGLVGLKPTVGLLSRTGIIPISATQDTAGPMARTVRDAAYLLSALVGVDPLDPATAASEGKAHADYTRFLDPAGLRGARLGVVRGFFGFDPRVDALMQEALAAMTAQAAQLIDPVDLPHREAIDQPSWVLMLYEFKAGLDAYLRGLGPAAPVKSLADVIAFNDAHADREMPYFGQDVFLLAQEKGDLAEPEYLSAASEARRLSRDQGLDAVLREQRLDALVAPTGGPAWVTDLVNGDHFGGGSSSPAAIAGYPNVTVPAGYIHGLPVGISFFGAAWSEPVLLRLAYAFEQATGHRQPPRFLPSAT